MRPIKIKVNIGKEIAEIARDFTHPIEVLREALQNSYDARAKEVIITAQPRNLSDGRRVLFLDIIDDGMGMDATVLEKFFSLGYSSKPKDSERFIIGSKGHGTKIYYQAGDIMVLTRAADSELQLASVEAARGSIFNGEVPEPHLLSGQDALAKANELGMRLTSGSGTWIRLCDFTPDGTKAIDMFTASAMENYLRWFSVLGTLKGVLYNLVDGDHMSVLFQGTDVRTAKPVEFGHDWPTAEATDLKLLSKQDPRRPFNYFRKSFVRNRLAVEGGYSIDVALLFEGRRGRLERDKNIRRQRGGGLYSEGERYGLWLCRDYIPIEAKFEWLNDFRTDSSFNPKRALIFVNCQDFFLTANRGSVGNSSIELLNAVKRAVFGYLQEVLEDKSLQVFLEEYEEDLIQRLREKDKKALDRRVKRYNNRKWCSMRLPDGEDYHFFEPTREITLYGLISRLQEVDPALLDLKILDYDDHQGLDMLVNRNGGAHDLLDRGKVSYVELKYVLEASINHSFDHMGAIICWECDLDNDELMTDITGCDMRYKEEIRDGVTSSHLVPGPSGRIGHVIKVKVLKRLLEETRDLVLGENPAKITNTGTSSVKKPRVRKPRI